MGGFMINGCGAADSFYPIQDFGMFHCNSCKKPQVFSLMEVKRKIRVFFVPTVSVNRKYAVACKKCKTGRYITEEEHVALASGHGKVDITPAGILIRGVSGTVSSSLPPVFDQPVPSARKELCPVCGKQQNVSGAFCSYCGADMKAARKPAMQMPENLRCRCCGKEQPVAGKFCSYCGADLDDRVSQPQPRPAEPTRDVPLYPPQPRMQPAKEEPAGTVTCPMCGSTQEKGLSYCMTCGEPVKQKPAIPQNPVCPHCGKTQKERMPFCGYCGKPMSGSV